ncbi:hypothetical protein TNCV_3918641 [Trichonephila clavipes]|nr:hypothetical protein TNCV_3918641 [Trichonephila clavipes]
MSHERVNGDYKNHAPRRRFRLPHLLHFRIVVLENQFSVTLSPSAFGAAIDGTRFVFASSTEVEANCGEKMSHGPNQVNEESNDEAHFWLNGYVNKQTCRIWSEANPQVYVETPLHPEKLTVWCALWAGGIQKR